MTAGRTVQNLESSVSMPHQESWHIASSYIDARGQRQHVDPSAIEALTRALASDNEDKFARRRVVAIRRNGPHRIYLPDIASVFRWELFLGTRVIASGETHTAALDLPTGLEVGSYRLVTEASNAMPRELLVVVAPDMAYQPPFFDDGDCVWVLAVQLYAIRSSHNWGHGDFTDLARLLRVAADVGAAGIGVNPLHALMPGQASPYSPSSRLFLNPLYIDVEAVPEFPGLAMPGLAEEVTLLRAADEIDYAAVYAVKRKALKAAFEVFRDRQDAGRREAFETFRKRTSGALARFSAFEHLRERFGTPWRGWAKQWHRITDALARVKDDDETEFQAFIQWIADQQLRACRDLARSLGLPVGLYLDVAVGVDPGGADVWSMPDAFSRHLSIGAPPDLYNPAGQNWGLAALHPQVLIDSDFASHRQTLRAVMQYAGAIRIDHALGLNRLFLIPAGTAATGGSYVSFPFDAMLAVTAQESVANRCLVIGEDLGTIPEGVHEALNGWGIWSYRVAMFERDGAENFRRPENFPQKAVVTFNTHDLPTIAGWATAYDIKTKTDLGLDPGETQAERDSAHNAMRNTLTEQNLPPELSLLSMLRYLSRARSQILAVQVEDILELQDQPNIPGTIDEHPNWRRRLPISLEDIATHQSLHRLATVLAEEGRRFGKAN